MDTSSPTHSLYASIKSLNVRGALIAIYIGHGIIVNNDIVHDTGLIDYPT